MSPSTRFRPPDTAGLGRLDGAVAVVTGGTRGIGLHTAAGLAQLGVDVVITGRDGGRGEQAVGAITAAVPGAAVRFAPTDLSTLAGVRVAAALLGQEVGRIDVLVHNAGVLLGSPVRTAEGLDLTLVVNHLAPFLLTHLLRPALHRADENSRPARVLTVTSGRPGSARSTPIGCWSGIPRRRHGRAGSGPTARARRPPRSRRSSGRRAARPTTRRPATTSSTREEPTPTWSAA